MPLIRRVLGGVIMVRVTGMRMGVIAISGRVLVFGMVRSHDEARSCQDAVIVRHDPARGGLAEVQRRNRALDLALVPGIGVQNRRDEHVAGPASDRIEMDLHQAKAPD